MAELLLLQMSGAPGSGKTTLAQTIGRQIGAVVIDHDVTKSALLGADVPVALAGHASYSVLDALARHLLLQGYSVIVDSPCLYTVLLERGQQLAQEVHARYRSIECVVEDIEELDRRLRTRPHFPSQLVGVYQPPSAGSGKTHAGEAVFRDVIANMKRPPTGYLTLDTTQPLESYLQTALTYLATGIGNR